MTEQSKRGTRRARTVRAVIGIGLTTALALGAMGTGAGADRGHDEHRSARIDHVFVVVLENYKTEDVTPAAMPYLASLTQQGVTLDEMYGVDHNSLSNYIAMTSGKTPTAKTKADCFQYDCIFESPDDQHIGDQLDWIGRSWKAYLESMPAPCAHPTVSGQLDPYLVGYATRHNPFVYYRDVIGPDITVTSPRCAAHDVPLTQLSTDLAAGAAPNYSLIVPNTCNDAHDRGANCSLPTADAWLAANIPPILASKAYRHHGALIVTFDESEGADTRGCCGNSAGGKIFTTVLSPEVAHPGSHSAVPYNHYSVLRTVEDAFGLPCLEHTCDASITPFGTDVWGARGHHSHHHRGHD